MAGLTSLVFMSLVLAAVSFGVGMLPLSFALSRAHLAKLSTFGTGLLLGAALGIIIPEGVETLVEAHPNAEPPTAKMALSLLVGFTFMLLVEQSLSAHAHGDPVDGFPMQNHKAPTSVEFDADLEDLERSGSARPSTPAPHGDWESANRKRAYPLTLGLFLHGLSDGLALGVSVLSDSNSPDASSDLSFVVFLALAIHKAPTTLALASSLLSMSLTRAECKRHIALFSAATPLGALAAYGAFTYFGAKAEWTGLAILVSGGSFLYVATVLQPVSHDQTPSSPDELGKKMRMLLVVVGMFVPFAIAQIVGHGH